MLMNTIVLILKAMICLAAERSWKEYREHNLLAQKPMKKAKQDNLSLSSQNIGTNETQFQPVWWFWWKGKNLKELRIWIFFFLRQDNKHDRQQQKSRLKISFATQ